MKQLLIISACVMMVGCAQQNYDNLTPPITIIGKSIDYLDASSNTIMVIDSKGKIETFTGYSEIGRALYTRNIGDTIQH